MEKLQLQMKGPIKAVNNAYTFLRKELWLPKYQVGDEDLSSNEFISHI